MTTKKLKIVGWGYDVEWTNISQSEFIRLTQEPVSIDLVWEIQASCGSAGSFYGPQNNLAWIVENERVRRRIKVPVKSLAIKTVTPKTDYLMVWAQEKKGTWCEYQSVTQFDASLVAMAGIRLQFVGSCSCRYDFASARYGSSKVVAGYDFMGEHFTPDFDDALCYGDVVGKSGEIYVVDRFGKRFQVDTDSS